jgi:hypothetical protein
LSAPLFSILLIQDFLDLQYYDIVDCIDNVAKHLWKEGSSADVWFHEKQNRQRIGSYMILDFHINSTAPEA